MRKLLAGFVALGLLFAVFGPAPADAALQQSGNPNGPMLSGYAPVPGGNYTSNVWVDIQYGDNGTQGKPWAGIKGYDNGGTSRAETICVQLVTYNINYSGLFNAPESCVYNVSFPYGLTVSVSASSYAAGQRAFGAVYKTWPDGQPLNGRQWSNSILG